MASVTLVLIVHDHQPIGNFDGVFQQAYADSYDPFLRFLEANPALRLALHTSGPLLQWIALHEPEYLTRLRELVDRGQVELWGGGFFEPILPAISEAGRHGQLGPTREISRGHRQSHGLMFPVVLSHCVGWNIQSGHQERQEFGERTFWVDGGVLASLREGSLVGLLQVGEESVVVACVEDQVIVAESLRLEAALERRVTRGSKAAEASRS